MQYTLGSSVAAYQFEPRTKEVILGELEQEELKQTFDAANPRGVKQHLFLGHGPTQEAFERRDLGTTNDLVYNKLQKTDTIIDPHNFSLDSTNRNKYHCNGKQSDLPCLGRLDVVRKPKAYADATKHFDLNCNKIGLRQ